MTRNDEQNKVEYHTTKVEYIRKMSHPPKVVLIIEHIEFRNKRECYFSVHPADVTETGTCPRYPLNSVRVQNSLFPWSGHEETESEVAGNQ